MLFQHPVILLQSLRILGNPLKLIDYLKPLLDALNLFFKILLALIGIMLVRHNRVLDVFLVLIYQVLILVLVIKQAQYAVLPAYLLRTLQVLLVIQLFRHVKLHLPRRFVVSSSIVTRFSHQLMLVNHQV